MRAVSQPMLDALLLAATLQGSVVVHHRSGVEEPVPAALIELWDAGQDPPRVTVSAHDGTFSMPDVSPGEHHLRISSSTAAVGGSIDVPADAARRPRVFMLLDPGCWGVYGQVRDRHTAAPVSGAEVFYLGHAIAGRNGEYFIDWGCPVCPRFCFTNSFFYGASAEGYRTVSIFGGRAEYVSGVKLRDFVLTPMDRSGAPAPRPRLSASRSNSSEASDEFVKSAR